jgi:hypothetical protein
VVNESRNDEPLLSLKMELGELLMLLPKKMSVFGFFLSIKLSQMRLLQTSSMIRQEQLVALMVV